MKLAVLGAGGRGFELARQVRRQAPWMEISAVAEPRADQRGNFAREFDLPAEALFKDWRSLMEAPTGCQAAIVATMDRDHRGPTEAALARGWHLLLEKPLAPDWEDCLAMAEAWRKAGSMLAVCHSLRYHQAFVKAHAWVESGRVGKIQSLDLLEQVGYWHFAHSFVRGNWAKQDASTFVLLAKSCHDIDLVQWFMREPCVSVASYGSLAQFTPASEPAGATDYCHQGCAAKDCAYDARKLYAPKAPCWGFVEHTASVRGCSPAEAAEAMIKGREGRCVYRCDNDVADHQSVLMRYAGGAVATFTLTAFTVDCARRLRIEGTEGTIDLEETPEGERLSLRRFDGLGEELFLPKQQGSHGGADALLVGAWLDSVRTGKGEAVRSGMEESLAGHRIVFAAERSRKEGRMVDVQAALAGKA
ncbi:MAG TPA: Gfo/Idh/MocA family oxidoreductase [bacterium]|jgi:predicted dehydrogenase|nr:Gfo/Idh/MocA family oxidoreductase [bacterium]